jgi:hypothetical protein
LCAATQSAEVRSEDTGGLLVTRVSEQVAKNLTPQGSTQNVDERHRHTRRGQRVFHTAEVSAVSAWVFTERMIVLMCCRYCGEGLLLSLTVLQLTSTFMQTTSTVRKSFRFLSSVRHLTITSTATDEQTSDQKLGANLRDTRMRNNMTRCMPHPILRVLIEQPSMPHVMFPTPDIVRGLVCESCLLPSMV